MDLDDSMIVMENEYMNIRKLQEQIIKHDIRDYEKIRKDISVKLIDLEAQFMSLRID